MQVLPFSKMSGAGNDFIIIDNRGRLVDESLLPGLIAKVCRRKVSAGADGLILIESSPRADFKWRFYNADGSRAEMCGNGARCAARFAVLKEIAGPRLSFETDAGLIEAEVNGRTVRVRMPDPQAIACDFSLELASGPLALSSINTGVPHVVLQAPDLEAAQVAAIGREVRFHPFFAPAGTNVNFVCARQDGSLAIRTYERGVEDETLACGTGAVAAALVAAKREGRSSPVPVLTRGGELLRIHFRPVNDTFVEIYLEGEARVIYEGQLCPEAWEY